MTSSDDIEHRRRIDEMVSRAVRQRRQVSMVINRQDEVAGDQFEDISPEEARAAVERRFAATAPAQDQPFVSTGAGRGRATPMMAKLPRPTTASPEDKALLEEQQVAQIETLMLKGIRAPRRISTLLNIPMITVKRLIERVQARWEIVGTGVNLRRYRGESLNRLTMIENELWVKAQNTNDDRMFVVIMRELLDVQKHRDMLAGLDKDSVERINRHERDNTVTRRMSQQDSLKTLAGRFAEIVRELRQEANTIPGRAVDLGEDTIEEADYVEDEEDMAEDGGWTPSDGDDSDPDAAPWDWEQGDAAER